MKAISIWNPWAILMAAGYKRIETRHWPPYGLKQGQLVAIHASKRWTYDERDTCEDWPFKDALAKAAERGLWTPEKPPLGAVVAIARFDRAESTNPGGVTLRNKTYPHLDMFRVSQQMGDEYDFGNYSAGRFGWWFTEVRPLQPITTKGMQGIFDWTPPANLADLYLEPINKLPPAPSRITAGLKCARCGVEMAPVKDYDPTLDLILTCGKLPDLDEWTEQWEAAL